MTRKLLLGILAVLATGLIIGVLLLPNDIKKIEQSLAKGRRAMDEENVTKIMSLISRDYSDTYGLTFGSLRSIFARTFFQVDSIDVRYTIHAITLHKKTATVSIDITVSGIMTNTRHFIVGGEDTPQRLKLTYTKEGFFWHVTESLWRDPGFLENVFGEPLPIH